MSASAAGSRVLQDPSVPATSTTAHGDHSSAMPTQSSHLCVMHDHSQSQASFISCYRAYPYRLLVLPIQHLEPEHQQHQEQQPDGDLPQVLPYVVRWPVHLLKCGAVSLVPCCSLLLL
jgi:hypothetical protein